MLNVKKTLTKILNEIKARPLTEIDWDSASVQRESRGGTNPFTVNHDGWLTGWVNNVGATGYGIYIQVNGKEVAIIPSTVNYINTVTANVPVKQGDTVNVRVFGTGQGYGIDIYPYK